MSSFILYLHGYIYKIYFSAFPTIFQQDNLTHKTFFKGNFGLDSVDYTTNTDNLKGLS